MNRLAVGSLSFVAGIILCAIVFIAGKYEAVCGDKFYEVNLFEVFQLACGAIASAVVAYYINIYLVQKSKNSGLFVELLCDAKRLARTAHDAHEAYVTSMNQNDQGKTLRAFKDLRISFGLITKVSVKLTKKLDGPLQTQLTTAAIRLKSFERKATDTPFGSKTAFTADEIEEIAALHSDLQTSLLNAHVEALS